MNDFGVEVGVSELIGLLNQTFDYAYPSVTVTGELANLRVSKGKWLYFDLKDESSSVKFFGTVYQLPGPLEDGMLVKVQAAPRLHNLYGFSMTVQSMQPAGEGSIKKAAALLQAKLQAEGLFDAHRKRTLPYPPTHIGLVTSGQSAAYADFIKIVNARWGGLTIQHVDVQVQGEVAPDQITRAIAQLNALAEPPEVIVLIRGGGSPEDLAAFSTEQVTRAVAGSRVPTLVAIGHEIDVSLAELAADMAASTPSNAAEMLVPDRTRELQNITGARVQLAVALRQVVIARQTALAQQEQLLIDTVTGKLQQQQQLVGAHARILAAYDPAAILRRGYAIIRTDSGVATSLQALQVGAQAVVQLHDGQADITINAINKES